MLEPAASSGNTLKQQRVKRNYKPRSRQSCTRCRKHKLKCNGVVPCTRCVSRNEHDSCELWHRPTGRPTKKAKPVAPQSSTGRTYFGLLLCQLSNNCIQQRVPIPNIAIQLARLCSMIQAKQNSIPLAKAIHQVSAYARIPVDMILQNSSAGRNIPAPQYVFAVLRGSDVFGVYSQCIRSHHQMVKVICSPQEWVNSVSPTVMPTARNAIIWVNQLFDSNPSAAQSCDDAQYEVVTIIQGVVRHSQLQNSIRRCVNEHNDEQIVNLTKKRLPGELELPTFKDQELYCSETETLESFQKVCSGIVDKDTFYTQLSGVLQSQLVYCASEQSESSVVVFEHDAPVVCSDDQGRLWGVIWAERCCIADDGGFCHCTRKIQQWIPVCSRAQVIASHLDCLLLDAAQGESSHSLSNGAATMTASPSATGVYEHALSLMNAINHAPVPRALMDSAALPARNVHVVPSLSGGIGHTNYSAGPAVMPASNVRVVPSLSIGHTNYSQGPPPPAQGINFQAAIAPTFDAENPEMFDFTNVEGFTQS